MKKYSLFEIILFVLVFIEEISKIYVVSQADAVNNFLDFLQWPLYLGLIFIICKKKYSFKQLLVLVILSCTLFYGYIQSGQATFLRGILLIYAAKDFPFQKIIRNIKNATALSFGISVLLWIFGISDSGIHRRGSIAIGYGHPNIAAQVIMLIVMLWILEKKDKLKKRHYIAVYIFSFLVAVLLDSRTSTIVLVCLPILVYFLSKTSDKALKKGLLKMSLEFSQVMVLCFSYFSAILLPMSGILKVLDLFFTNRVFLNYYLLDQYPLTLFGQNVSLHFEGVYNSVHDYWGAYITCDNTYILSLLLLGVIPTLIFAVGYIFVIKKAIKNNDYLIISISIMLAIYGFCESQLVEIYNNFIYFYIFAIPMVSPSMKKPKTNY